MQVEMIDRFGLPPEPARALLDSHQLRLLAGPLGIARVDATHEALQLQFQADAPVDRGKIIALVQKKKNIRFAGTDRLHMDAKMPEWPQRVLAVRELLQQLAA